MESRTVDLAPNKTKIDTEIMWCLCVNCKYNSGINRHIKTSHCRHRGKIFLKVINATVTLEDGTIKSPVPLVICSSYEV